MQKVEHEHTHETDDGDFRWTGTYHSGGGNQKEEQRSFDSCFAAVQLYILLFVCFPWSIVPCVQSAEETDNECNLDRNFPDVFVIVVRRIESVVVNLIVHKNTDVEKHKRTRPCHTRAVTFIK